ncbi:hypothetical protein ACOJBM_06615 [Rhizobium beringeri]|uniref:Uncharacterized protein n=2 Tax=Rhizobium TaxID=379 RepID=A0A179BXB4_RHILE|nr:MULTISPECIES: hypothetical protein [Rhizobium]API57349.1 hypothetical protein BMW22_38755 [Rhizobium leguminosarum]NKL25022.1 hypothetical protein [Rhizobium leguminosarum bv. viciae]OAP95734.1 hypothetical protein A4U53_39075 [Rhizobium leguminosarum]
MSSERKNLIDAALSLDEGLSPRVFDPPKPNDPSEGTMPADATVVPDVRNLTISRPVKTIAKV